LQLFPCIYGDICKSKYKFNKNFTLILRAGKVGGLKGGSESGQDNNDGEGASFTDADGKRENTSVNINRLKADI
jgi:hypothetical protein